MLSFRNVHKECTWTKMDLAKRLGVENSPSVMCTSQLAGGFIVLGKTESNIELLRQWERLAVESNYRYSDDSASIVANHPSFVAHRHGQSISSLLRKIRGTEVTHYEVQAYSDSFARKKQSLPAWATRLRGEPRRRKPGKNMEINEATDLENVVDKMGDCENGGMRLKRELLSFSGLWEGGYFEGDPLNPLAKSSYGPLGFMSVLHATYLRCIRPYVNSETVALEIGPGRGAWTRALLPSREVWALDALPERHNRFFEYLGHPKNVKHYQVEDFECEILPDNYFDYMFSFGCLCHVSFEGIKKYAVNIRAKLKPGSNCFWMVADYNKYNAAVSNHDALSIWAALEPGRRRNKMKLRIEDDQRRPGRWFHAGIQETCSMLREAGYHVVDSDVGTCLRDPIVHFVKGEV